MIESGARYRLSDTPGNLGLRCTTEGLALAGVPLLEWTGGNFVPRSEQQIRWLIDEAYRGDVSSEHLMRGLDVVAQSLNEGQTTRAMIAAVLLKLPELDWDGAARIAHAEDALAKVGFDPEEQRDWHGRWTTGGGGSAGPANDHLRAPGRAIRLPYGRLPFLPPNGLTDDGHLYDAAWYGTYHEEVKFALAESLKADGLTVQTEIFFRLDGSDRIAKADIAAMLPGDPTTLHLVDIKTGSRSELTPAQEWVYPSYVHGDIVSSPDPKIMAFGYLPGQKLPPGGVTIWYEPGPGEPRCLIPVLPVIPFIWRAGPC